MQRRMLGEGNQVRNGEAQLWWGEGSHMVVRCSRSCRRVRSQRLATPKLVPSRGYSVPPRINPPPTDLHLRSRPQIKPCCKHSDPRLGASIGLIRSGDFTAVDSSQAPLGPFGSLAPPRLGLAYPFSNTSTLRRWGVGIGRSGRSWTR